MEDGFLSYSSLYDTSSLLQFCKGAAIFFEFKHYKLKKRFTSTKCFAFMEMDEIKPGPTVIELDCLTKGRTDKILLPQPPEPLELQVCTTTPSESEAKSKGPPSKVTSYSPSPAAVPSPQSLFAMEILHLLDGTE